MRWSAEASSSELFVHGFMHRAPRYFILVSYAQPGSQTEGHEERGERGWRRKAGEQVEEDKGSEQYVNHVPQ